MYAFFQELIQAGVYKRSQGRITRQLTWGAIAVILSLGLWRLSLTLGASQWEWVKNLNRSGFQFWLPGLLLAAGLWIAYRVVNLPLFADFLIAVEAEMNKVSWPSRSELFRASTVVLFTIFFLAVTLFGFDLFWKWFFGILNVFPKGESTETAMAGFLVDWRVFASAVPKVIGPWF